MGIVTTDGEKMKIHKIEFKAFEVLESCLDGVGYNHVGYFEKYDDALKCINMKPSWPRHIRTINESTTRYVCESFEEHKELLEDSERAVALTKLTDTEREALGV